MALSIDASRCTVTLRTRAGGLFSVVAHDLELSAKVARGEASKENDQWHGEVAIEPSSIRVVGVLKRGAVDRKVLSAAEVRDIEHRITNDIFGGVREIVVRGSGTASAPNLRVIGKREVTPDVRLSENDHVFQARGSISIKGLGLGEVKGPLGAFVIKDAVEVEATIAFTG